MFVIDNKRLQPFTNEYTIKQQHFNQKQPSIDIQSIGSKEMKNEDLVYVLNVRFWKSNDSGKTFESINTPHGDHHDLCISPSDEKQMMMADDGGAQVSSYGGYLVRENHKTGESRMIDVWSDNPIGWAARDIKFRLMTVLCGKLFSRTCRLFR